VHVAHETVATPWEQKGLLMRSLVENIRDKELVLVDGVKVCDGDMWALVLPDPEKPLTHVWAEGPSSRDARTIAQQYVRQIRQSIRTG
jgi:mannose-1-phosphate guanylyltransferase / phosphomannomutase